MVASAIFEASHCCTSATSLKFDHLLLAFVILHRIWGAVRVLVLQASVQLPVPGPIMLQTQLGCMVSSEVNSVMGRSNYRLSPGLSSTSYDTMVPASLLQGKGNAGWSMAPAIAPGSPTGTHSLLSHNLVTVNGSSKTGRKWLRMPWLACGSGGAK